MNRLLLGLAVVLVCGAVALGLAVVGGPEQARKAERDRTRMVDLRTVGRYYRCRAMQDAAAGEGADQPRCGGLGTWPDVQDPLTGAEYDYRALGADGFEVCATFETRNPRGHEVMRFDGQRGCLIYRRSADGTEFIRQ